MTTVLKEKCAGEVQDVMEKSWLSVLGESIALVSVRGEDGLGQVAGDGDACQNSMVSRTEGGCMLWGEPCRFKLPAPPPCPRLSFGLCSLQVHPQPPILFSYNMPSVVIISCAPLSIIISIFWKRKLRFKKLTSLPKGFFEKMIFELRPES